MVIDQQTSLVLHALCAWSFSFSLSVVLSIHGQARTRTTFLALF